MYSQKAIKLWGCLLAVVLLLAACGKSGATSEGSQRGTAAPEEGQSKDGPKRGGTITVALVNEPDTLDPHASGAGPDRNILFQIYGTLLRFDKNLNLVPGIVKEWKSPDPLTFEFKLNEGIKFQDETDLNAQAVVWNFERMMNKDLKLVPYSDLLDVQKVVAVDNLTFQIKLKQPLAPLLALLADRAGMMISPAAYEKFGKNNYGRNPVGAGPFKFVQWRQGDSVTVERFNGYFQKGLPYLDKAVFRIIPDAAVRGVGLQSGDIDVIAEVPASLIKNVKANPSLVLAEGEGLAWGYLMFNVAKPPFDNLKVRQALAWAVDRQALVETVMEGQGTVAQSPFSPSSWAYDKSLDDRYGYDKAKAKALLSQAGFGPGKPLKLQMQTTTDPARLRQTEMVQAFLKEVGVEASIQPYELATVIENMRNGNYDVISLYFSGRADPDGNAFTRWHSKGTLNYMRYKSPDMDSLLEASRATYDPKQRADIFKKVNQLMLDDLPLSFLTFAKAQVAYNKRVKQYVLIPDNMVRLLDVWVS